MQLTKKPETVTLRGTSICPSTPEGLKEDVGDPVLYAGITAFHMQLEGETRRRQAEASRHGFTLSLEEVILSF
jgi:hypothetical protein